MKRTQYVSVAVAGGGGIGLGTGHNPGISSAVANSQARQSAQQLQFERQRDPLSRHDLRDPLESHTLRDPLRDPLLG